MNENQVEESEARNEGFAKVAGMLVYSGVVAVATLLFLSFVLTAFDEEQYFTRFIMVVGGVLVGFSTIAFPLAIHNWATSKNHRRVALGLYVGEILFIAFNTLVSFSVLMSIQNGTIIPPWMKEYEPYSILSIVYVLAAWGALFITDPSHEEKAIRKDVQVRKARAVAKVRKDFLDNSAEAEQMIAAEAQRDVMRMFGAEQGSKKRVFFPADTEMQKLEELPNSRSH